MRAAIDEAASTYRQCGTRAHQTCAVVNGTAPYIDRQVAERLNIATAVINASAGQCYGVLSSYLPAPRIGDLRCCRVDVARGTDKARRVIELARSQCDGALGENAACRTGMRVRQRLAVGVNGHSPAGLQAARIVGQPSALDFEQSACGDRAARVVERPPTAIQSHVGATGHHAIRIGESIGRDRDGPRRLDTARRVVDGPRGRRHHQSPVSRPDLTARVIDRASDNGYVLVRGKQATRIGHSTSREHIECAARGESAARVRQRHRIDAGVTARGNLAFRTVVQCARHLHRQRRCACGLNRAALIQQVSASHRHRAIGGNRAAAIVERGASGNRCVAGTGLNDMSATIRQRVRVEAKLVRRHVTAIERDRL